MGDPPPPASMLELKSCKSLLDIPNYGTPLPGPLSGFQVFCDKHRTLETEKNPHLDYRSVTSILEELWDNLPNDEKDTYLALPDQEYDALKETPYTKVGKATTTDSGEKTLVLGKLAEWKSLFESQPDMSALQKLKREHDVFMKAKFDTKMGKATATDPGEKTLVPGKLADSVSLFGSQPDMPRLQDIEGNNQHGGEELQAWPEDMWGNDQELREIMEGNKLF